MPGAWKAKRDGPKAIEAGTRCHITRTCRLMGCRHEASPCSARYGATAMSNRPPERRCRSSPIHRLKWSSVAPMAVECLTVEPRNVAVCVVESFMRHAPWHGFESGHRTPRHVEKVLHRPPRSHECAEERSRPTGVLLSAGDKCMILFTLRAS